VQIRGIHGEHSETADHVYDISNKRRLGLSEKDLVQDMYNGVKAMIESDKSMRPNPKAKSQTFIEKVVDVAEKSAAKIETNLSEKKSEAKIAASSSALSIKKSVP